MKQISRTKYQLIFNIRTIFCCLFLLLTLPVAMAAEPPSEEWHYTLRPGDNLQKVSQGLLNRQYTWTDLIRHNRIDQVASLAPGSIIRIPMHWLKYQPEPAKVKSLSGSVQIKRASQSLFKVMKPSMLIRVGDEVATRKGNILIEFADGSTVRLEEQSNLIFNKLSHFGKTGMVDTRLRLKKGTLSTEVTPLVKGSRYEITTPSAVAAVRGTKFRISSENQETKLEVVEGSVDFKGEHGSTVVKAGQGARIKQGSAIIEKTTLPSAPTPMFASKTIEDLPSKLSWEKQAKAKEYKFQLTDKDKNDKLVKTSKSTKPEVDLTHIQNGTYDVAMRAIDKKGYEGIDSVTKLSVDIASEIPTLLSPLDKSIIDIPTPEFNWKMKEGNTLSKLELARDASFTEKLIKFEFGAKHSAKLKQSLQPGSYHWRVVTLADDAEQSYSEIRQFTLRGILKQVKILSVNYVDSQVGLFWNKLDNAKGYILQISDSTEFDDILKEQTLGKARAHLRLNPGKQYYARVKGISDEMFTSEFGPAKALYIEPK